MFCQMKEMLNDASKGGYGIGAFNIHCLEVIPAMISAAEELKAPVILQVSVGTAEYTGFEPLAILVRDLGEKASIPVALHLDHCKDLAVIQAAIDAGFSSVMIDASSLPFDENVALSAKVVEMAAKTGVTVEAELGTVGRGDMVDSEQMMYTDPLEAFNFVKRTGVDALAIAIGTHHGQYKAKTAIRLDVLESIKKMVPIPLVLHGGTGVSNEDVKKCVAGGIAKLNIGTELNVTWIRKAQELLAGSAPHFPIRDLMAPCNAALADVVKDKILLTGSVNKA